jgi:peptidyl-prolyl cis-trans isomerase A (cyclophilin A)
MNLPAETRRRGGPLARHLAMVGLLALAGWGLAGCGGSNDDEPGVTSMVANNTRYSRVATVTISGRNLQAGITMQMEGGCENLTRVAGGTDDTQQYTCEVAAVGEHVANVYSTGGAFLGRLTFKVPQPQVSLTTSKGVITLDLDAVNAPVTTRNFLNYIGSGFYRNVLVHRAIPARGLVSGGYTTGLVAKAPTQPAIKLESSNGLKNVRGALGMVRGEAFDSATSQWYINTADNPDLDYVSAEQPGFAVFGTVLSGLDVADAITAVETKSDPAKGLTDVPVVEILITAASQTR